MPKRLNLSSILKFGKVFLEVSKVPSRTRGVGVAKILGGVGVPFFYVCDSVALILLAIGEAWVAFGIKTSK